jgi:DnaD/phage-associated family protein
MENINMPKFRQLHTKIIDSFDFNDMPNDTVRLIWVLLPLILDSEGRGIDKLSWIKSKMFPMRDVEDKEIVEAFDWFASKEMIIRYSVNSHDYFYIPTFKDYQKGTEKEAASVLPAPIIVVNDSNPTQELLKSRSRVDQELVCVAASASESESESESGKKNIFRVYEREIGIITGSISDALIEAEKDYPPEWIEAALKEAAVNNKRSWKYAEAILKRWKIEGKGDGRKPEPKVITYEDMGYTTPTIPPGWNKQ